MKTLIYICFALGILNVCASGTNKPNKMMATKQIADDTIQAAAAADIAKDVTNDATKDKRQTKDTKDAATAVYANHRSDTASSGNRNSNTNSDDPEDPQETIYGTNARQFLIRPQHQQQQNEEEQQQRLVHEHQPPQQLRNYAATIRPHSTQLLEQSQEIQHYAYLQDINQNQQKVQSQGKSESAQSKKSPTVRVGAHSQPQTSQVEEAEQQYAVAVEQPIPQNHPRARIYRPQIPYHVALQQQQQQQQQQGQQQQYQIIPEEQFLKILQEELHARQAYHDDQVRRQQSDQQQNLNHRQQQQQQQQQQQHQQQQQQQLQQQQQSAAAAASQKVTLQSQGLGNYRQRIGIEDERDQPEYVQYVQRLRGGPKYLPLPQPAQQEEQSQSDPTQQHPLPQLPPQIAYYQPQISYKTLPNHPLAKSSLEKEIEKLLAINTPDVSPVQIVDNSNEPSALINHQHQARPAPQNSPRSHISAKAYTPSTVAPKGLLENNNQPFLPSLFQFSGFQQPTQNYPTPVPQHVIDAKKLGPVVYPQQSPTPAAETPVQPSQFYYPEVAPSPRPKAFRPKYGTKFATTPTPIKAHQNDINYPVHNKYTQPLLYEIERPSPTAGPAPTHFYPSPPDLHRNIPSPPTAPPTSAATTKYSPNPTDFRQFALPGPSPSQSSIYVSQGTGIATPSRPINTVKPKTVDDLKQLHLPQPGGKPLTQTEFQALVDAGYPVTAVPVPVPIPYEQYVKDHPDYRNQPPPQAPALPVNYEHLMRFAQLQQHHQQVPQYGPHRGQHLQHPRSLIQRPSEPSVKIISSASEPQTATAIGGGSITYLRAISENQKRRPRDETETKVVGAKEEEKVEVKQVEDKNEK